MQSNCRNKENEYVTFPISVRCGYGLSLTPDAGTAVHVFRCVFEQAVTPVMVFDVVEGDGLKAPPAQR